MSQLLSEKKALRCQLCSTHFTAVRINNCLKISHVIKVASIMNSVTNGSYQMPTTKLTLFVMSKGEWDTKEAPGKSMKNTLCVQRYGEFGCVVPLFVVCVGSPVIIRLCHYIVFQS